VKSFYAPAAGSAVAFDAERESSEQGAAVAPAHSGHTRSSRAGSDYMSAESSATAARASSVRFHAGDSPSSPFGTAALPNDDPGPARIAVYDAAGAPPRVEEIAPQPVGEYISHLASRTYEIARAMGGSIPFSVVNEVVENFIHADFREPVVTILDSGDTIRFSDQGPGIANKRLAVEPGYTTATREMKRYVRGVGSGLPLAKECLSFSGGSLVIEDNLGCGAVVTVTNSVSHEADDVPPPVPATPSGEAPPAPVDPVLDASAVGFNPSTGGSLNPGSFGGVSPHAPAGRHEPRPSLPGLEPSGAVSTAGVARLTNRQKRVLALVMEAGSAGPSLVARELAIGLSTAYRDLARLEDLGLISADESGKRIMTAEGADFLKKLLHA